MCDVTGPPSSLRVAYSRTDLLALYTPVAPATEVVDLVRGLGLRATCRLRGPRLVRPLISCSDRGVVLSRYRGCRAGRRVRRPVLYPVGNGAAIIVGNWPPSSDGRAPRPPPDRSMLRVHVDRHSFRRGAQLSFGCLNVQSLSNKLDDLLDVQRDKQIDVMLLVETWHDSDSVSLRRLRVDGFQVVDRPRPRARDDTMATNHGGVAAVAASGVRLSTLDLGARPATFEFLCVRVTSRSSACVVAVVYRPGSVAVSSSFFSELSDVLDRLATFIDPVFLVGDINIRLDRPDDPAARQLTDILAAHGLTNRVATATHDRGGMLDVVITRDDLPSLTVDVLDVGLSDHRLLCWMTPLSRPTPVYTEVTYRPWRKFDALLFRAALLISPLCCPDSWSALGVDELAQLYDTEITALLDRMVPVQTMRRRHRVSDPWFDDDCRVAKRSVRQLERAARHVDPTDRAAATAATAAWTARRRAYRGLLRQKREQFWRSKVDAERSSPQQLWRSVDELMGRGRVPMTSDISADAFHRFFDDKVAGIRASTDDAPPPSFTAAPPGCHLAEFRAVTTDDVTAAVRVLPNKQCESDPMSTSLLKDNVDVLAPFLVELFNRSLALGVVPAVFKKAFITPRLKKPDLDSADIKSHRPISNLSVLSKLLERLVAQQLLTHLMAFELLPPLQSAYRAHHSTETAVLKVLSDILQAIDSGDLALLALLDLSAAFDTVDHSTLLRRLRTSYGLGGTAISWFVSYLSGRMQFVRCGAAKSAATLVLCGVPQGSVLGPILFLLYTADLLRLIEKHGLHPHLYADDTQIYGFCRPGATAQLQSRVSACINDVASWMRSNRLQLNTAKTEVLWCSSARRQHQIPGVPLRVGADDVIPVRAVRDLGIHIDSDVSMTKHVTKTVSTCFAALRQIRSIRRSVSRPVLVSLVVSLVLTRLDYGSATLAGLPGHLLDRLQSAQNAAARLVCSARKFEHIMPLLRDLHWLRIPDRIEFRLAVLVFRCLRGTAPAYLANELHRVTDIETRRRLRSSSTAALVVPQARHSTIGDRAFPIAAARVWNSLPPSVTEAPSLAVFKQRLKTELFSRCYGSVTASN
jgi:exonuclease III